MILTERQLNNFLSKIGDTSDCWLWDASKARAGYGRVNLNGKVTFAHLVAYELFVGPIPEGLQLDHLCRVTNCICPTHLEPVTQEENKRRQGAAVTHCPQGHDYSQFARKRSYGRDCLICHRERERNRKRLKNAA